MGGASPRYRVGAEICDSCPADIWQTVIHELSYVCRCCAARFQPRCHEGSRMAQFKVLCAHLLGRQRLTKCMPSRTLYFGNSLRQSRIQGWRANRRGVQNAEEIEQCVGTNGRSLLYWTCDVVGKRRRLCWFTGGGNHCHYATSAPEGRRSVRRHLRCSLRWEDQGHKADRKKSAYG
jgi:hypothetical protein